MFSGELQSLIEGLKDNLKGDILEIGSDRGEGSTLYLSGFAQQNDLNFYSVDFEEEAFLRAQAIIGENAYHMRGEDFLESHYPQDRKIGFAYLDNFDYIFPHSPKYGWALFSEVNVNEKWVREQAETYSKHSLVLDNRNSKQAHLDQTLKIANSYADDFCAILFDDTFLNQNNHVDGKGGYAVPYLIKSGWKVFKHNFYSGHAEWDQFILLTNEGKA